MDPQSPLGRYQRQRLTELRELGVCTDLSLCAHLTELGQPCSRPTLCRYRSGERPCPLGLLDLVLSHCTEEERIAVLSLWARPLGLAVVPAELGPRARRQLTLLADELQQAATVLQVLSSETARSAA